MENTKIEWCDHTFNSWHGCVKVSAGCANCYAETLSKRFGKSLWGKDAERRIASDKYWAQPIKWNREARESGIRRRVFCASMADVFEDRPDLIEPRTRLFRLIAETPNLDWLLLTKRPENLRSMIPWNGDPWPNVWLGTSAEDQKTFNERIPHLFRIPATIHFVSCEPLLGGINFTLNRFDPSGNRQTEVNQDTVRGVQQHHVNGAMIDAPLGGKIDWVIVGGESGPGARMMETKWAYDIVLKCREVGTPVFMKQAGSVLARAWGLRDKKGGDMSEWPSWMQVRQWPDFKKESK